MRNGIIAIAMLLTFAADTSKVGAQETQWQLVFSDEFNLPDGSQPDPKKWNRTNSGTSPWNRWINSNSKDVVYIKNGRLICRAIPNRSNKNEMLTGAIDTKGKFSFQYGKVEVRMRTNMKVGNFPAAWMVPVPGADKRYGEIDIVEMFGNQGKSAHTVHTHRSFTLKKEGLTRERKIDLNVKKWHVYGVEWDKNRIIWTIDGREVFRYAQLNDPKMQDEGQWTFDRPFYLILNQSVGNGSHPLLVPNVRTTYETQFDWIRVYQKK